MSGFECGGVRWFSANGTLSAWEAVSIPPATWGLRRWSECPAEGGTGSYPGERPIESRGSTTSSGGNDHPCSQE